MTDTEVRDDPLTQLLREQIADQELLVRVLTTLEPYFVIAKSDGPYPLKSAEELDEAEIAQAIQQTLALDEVPSVGLISLSDSIEETEPLSCHSFWHEVHSRFDRIQLDRLMKSLREATQREVKDNLEAVLKQGLQDSIQQVLRLNLEDRLGRCIWTTVWAGELEHCITQARHDLMDSLWLLLINYLGFVVADAQDMVDRIEPLVRLQAECIVLGRKQDDENTHLVLTA